VFAATFSFKGPWATPGRDNLAGGKTTYRGASETLGAHLDFTAIILILKMLLVAASTYIIVHPRDKTVSTNMKPGTRKALIPKIKLFRWKHLGHTNMIMYDLDSGCPSNEWWRIPSTPGSPWLFRKIFLHWRIKGPTNWLHFRTNVTTQNNPSV